MVNIIRNVLIMLKNLPQMHLKALQKESLKTAQATVNLIGKKLLIELQKSQKNLFRIL